MRKICDCLNKFKSMKKFAFTLAEVMIVLGIIGVIAEMTIPTLITGVNDQAAVVAFKQEVNIIQQAILSARTEEGIIDDWYNGSDVNAAGVAVNAILAKYLKVSKNCGVSAGCSPSFRMLSKNISGTFNYDGSAYSKMVLANGSILIFNVALYSSQISEIDFIIDINGFKGPNRWGHDMFKVFVYSNRGAPSDTKPQVIYPFGYPIVDPSLKEVCSSISSNNYIGYGDNCSAWAYYQGNLDYKYVDDLDWDTKTHK